MKWFDGPDTADLYKALRANHKLNIYATYDEMDRLVEADEAAREREWDKAFRCLFGAMWEAGYVEGCRVTEAELEKHTKKKYGSWGDYYGNPSRWEEDIVGGKLNE